MGSDWPVDPDEIPARVAAFRAVLAVHEISLEVVGAAEIEASFATELSDEQLATLALGAGRRLLIEPPMSSSVVGMERIVFQLRMRGHEILLAHPERCPGFQRDVQLLERLVSDGALTQVTARALAGRFGGVVARFAHELVSRGLVHSIASDAHDVARRAPGMRPELEQAGLGDYVDWWCRRVPAAILDGVETLEPPEPWPPRAVRRRRFGCSDGADGATSGCCGNAASSTLTVPAGATIRWLGQHQVTGDTTRAYARPLLHSPARQRTASTQSSRCPQSCRARAAGTSMIGVDEPSGSSASGPIGNRSIPFVPGCTGFPLVSWMLLRAGWRSAGPPPKGTTWPA